MVESLESGNIIARESQQTQPEEVPPTARRGFLTAAASAVAVALTALIPSMRRGSSALADDSESGAAVVKQRVRWGMVIDVRRCIGCHACTTACKSEHDVPIGVNRTYVKQVEKGKFPDTRRIFSVMRCNHCTDAPCVTICPVEALYTREDGIVDFDNNRCIGCKNPNPLPAAVFRTERTFLKFRLRIILF